jgi:hypothetical protein
MNLPIDIINKIFGYIAEVNNEIVYTQYDSRNNREIYKINRFSNKLLEIQALYCMKRYYPIYYSIQNIEPIKKHMNLYENGKRHYMQQIRH